MAAAVTSSSVFAEFTGNTLRVHFSVVLSGTYPTTGDILSLAGLDQIKASGLPFKVTLQSTKAGQTNLFEYQYSLGASLALGKIQVFTGAAAQTALTELNAGAYPAGVTSDTIVGEALFLVRNS